MQACTGHRGGLQSVDMCACCMGRLLQYSVLHAIPIHEAQEPAVAECGDGSATTADSSMSLLCSLPASYSSLKSLRDLLLGDNYLSVSLSSGPTLCGLPVHASN